MTQAYAELIAWLEKLTELGAKNMSEHEGMWNFSDDKLRLEAHEAQRDQYDSGYRDGRDESAPQWAWPLSVGTMVVALLASSTYVAVTRTDIVWSAKPQEQPPSVASYMILDKNPMFCGGTKFMISQQESGRLLVVCETRQDWTIAIAEGEDLALAGIDMDPRGALNRLVSRTK